MVDGLLEHLDHLEEVGLYNDQLDAEFLDQRSHLVEALELVLRSDVDSLWCLLCTPFHMQLLETGMLNQLNRFLAERLSHHL